MPSYQEIVFVHALFGVPALIAFWFAALARKGGAVHKLAGKVQLAAMTGILLTTLPIIALRAMEGKVVSVVFLCYLTLIVVTAIYLSWRSIRRRHDYTRYAGASYRALGATMFLYGVAILLLSPMADNLPRSLFMAGLSMIGIVVGSSMWLQVFRGPSDRRWWLSQHMNGAALNFAATHASFFGLGLKSVLPALSGPWMHTSTQLGIVALALILRIWLGRRYLGRDLPAAAHDAESRNRGVLSPSLDTPK